MTTIISWNTNGISKLNERGFFDLVKQEQPDIICLQETHTKERTIQNLAESLGNYYHAATDSVRIGRYETCGVAVISREKPVSVRKGFHKDQTGYEGRILICEFENFVIYNCYFPTSTGKTPERREFTTRLKRDFYRDCTAAVRSSLDAKKEVILCGDFNTAREECDVANAKLKKNVSGFTKDDRDAMERLVSENNLTDAFRAIHRDKVHYTWWFNRACRNENLGWRIDYFLISEGLKDRIATYRYYDEGIERDHCPIVLTLSNKI